MSSLSLSQEDEEVAIVLNTDFVAAQRLRENIIPRAVLYFTGEAIEDDEVNALVCCFSLPAMGLEEVGTQFSDWE